MDYEIFALNNEEITKQTTINNLLITPYTDGICVNFTNEIALSCNLINGIIVKIDKYIIYVEDNIFYVGVAK